jgi:hypothetical protein
VEYIIDGRHRLETASMFADGDFAWKNKKGQLLHWEDLSDRQRDIFNNTKVNFIVCEGWDDESAQKVFGRLNLGQPLQPKDRLFALNCPALNWMKILSEFFRLQKTISACKIVDEITEDVFKGENNVVKANTEKSFEIACKCFLMFMLTSLTKVHSNGPLIKHLQDYVPSEKEKDRAKRGIDILLGMFEKKPADLYNASDLYTIVHFIHYALKENIEIKWSTFRDFYVGIFSNLRNETCKTKDTRPKYLKDYYKKMRSGPNSKTALDCRLDLLLKKYKPHLKKRPLCQSEDEDSNEEVQIKKPRKYNVTKVTVRPNKIM